MAMWMVRAGAGGSKAEDFRTKGLVGFGDERLGKLQLGITKAALLQLYAEKYPEDKEGSRASWASQLLRLATEVQVGDAVLTYDAERRVYLLGKIVSPYEWMPGVVEGLPHVRKVEWTHEVARSAVSVTARNSLGAIQTLFQLPPEAAEELASKKLPVGVAAPPQPESKASSAASDEAAGLATLRDETVKKADEFIEDAISHLDPFEMQELVAGILRAMGYRTIVSPPGSDRGVDIMASPDGLMLQEPRIFVEVKHRTSSQMGSKEIRSFLGGRKPGDRCLYVSTGGFSKDAHYEADRSTVPLMLINLEGLRKLLIDNYDGLDPDARALVPLRKFYWPVLDN
jgi:restriction system protein